MSIYPNDVVLAGHVRAMVKGASVSAEEASKGSFGKARRNAVWLGVSQIVSLGMPLVELPFLARALGIEHYGALLFIQAMAVTCSVFIEYGFHFSGARKLAAAEGDEQSTRKIISGITTAKVVFSIIAIPVFSTILITKLSVGDVSHSLLFFSLIVLSFGFSPTWYFLGREELIFPAVFDLFVRAIGLGSIIVFVRQPDDFMLVLAIQATVSATNALVLTSLMFRAHGCARPSILGVIEAVRDGWHFFIYKGVGSVTSSVATTVLGLSSTTAQVGLFAPSEKLIRAGNTFLAIVLSAFYSAAVRSAQDDGIRFRKRVFVACTVMFVILIMCSIAVAPFSGAVVEVVFGVDYAEAATLLSFMIFLLPIRAASGGLTILWLIPAGKEALSSRLALTNLLFVFFAGYLLSQRYGAYGMAAALGIGEIGLLISIVWAVKKTDQRTS